MLSNQCVMITTLNNPAMIQNHNSLTVSDSRQSVRDYKNSSSGH